MKPRKIQILSDQTINQIAAGEVVEGPSAVIKELVENAVDAGAGKITVEIKGGGHFYIRVADDGCGMSKDDAILAFERHATSKIQTLDDLTRLTSMGFRGEALASIASVAKVEMSTSEGEVGTKVICHGGKLIQVAPVSRQKGTTIEVSSLFYNTPARKKFQKGPQQSTAEIVKMMTRLALAHPACHFELISQEKEMLIAKAKMWERVEEVLGKEYTTGASKVMHREEGYGLSGFLGSPSSSRLNRSGQYLFINQRPIVSPLISKILQTAFGTRLAAKMHPIFVLWLEVPPDSIDVNVHPQKSEVRFRDESKIQAVIEKGVSQALFAGKAVNFTISKPSSFAEPSLKYEMRMPSQPPLPRKEPSLQIDLLDRIQVWGLLKEIAFIKVEAGFALFGEETGEEEVLLLDLFAAESRIQSDQILSRLEQKGSYANQALLFPETLVFTKAEALIIEKNLDLLNAIGMTLRFFGSDCFLLEAVAPYLSSDKCKDLLLELIEELKIALDFHKIISILLRAKRKRIYRIDEVKPLLRELMKMKDHAYAPSGKRIYISYQIAEISALFKEGARL